MLSSILKFYDDYLAPAVQAGQDPADASRCAAAALLAEMAHMDDVMTPAEHEAIFKAVRESFQLSPEQAERLVACAMEERERATDYHQFTSLINAQFDAGQRAALIEQLWQVAYADRVLCKHEEYLARKVANLLHVPHSAYIAAKHRVLGDDPAAD
jgi:uncharacterized tellurite resistance protein B-like protein